MSTAPESRAERKERTRQAILEAALDLCEDSSLVALSLRQIAKQVGIVPTAFYRHFESIDQVGLALVDQSFASLRAMIRDTRQVEDPRWQEIVDRSLALVVEHVRRQHRHFAFIARERFAGPLPVREAISREIELFERDLATDLARLPGNERWSTEDLRVLSGLIVTVVVAFAEHILASPAGSDAERRALGTARTQMRVLLIGAANWRSPDR